jgi:hypothetical protein
VLQVKLDLFYHLHLELLGLCLLELPMLTLLYLAVVAAIAGLVAVPVVTHLAHKVRVVQ